MHINDTQQEHSYDDFIQAFSSLSGKIREKDKSTNTAVVNFSIVKFLVERSASGNKSANWDKDEVYEVFQKEFKNMKEAKQELQEEAKKVLGEYIENNVEKVSIEGVSIYGNCVEIKLKADKDKNEFKISEFLNSDFCTNNKISGFSTLHDNGKSGMHGVVSGGIRHYVVTDGSYEMTLKWYAEGKECEITINIDANGIDLVKGDDFSLERLEANQDVKIGGLFLHQIQFREKEKENEVQHGKEGYQTRNRSSEIIIKGDDRNVSVQATHVNRGVGSQTTRLGSDDESDLGYESQEENSQNKRTPPPPPFRTSSLPSEKGVLNEQEGAKSVGHQNGRQSELSSNTADIAQKRFSENVLKKIKEEKPIYKWLKDKIEGKENNQNLDALEKKLSQKSGQGNIVEKREKDSSRPLSPISTDGSKDMEKLIYNKMLENIEEFQANPSAHTNSRNDSGYSSPIHDDRGKSKVDPKHLTQKLEEEKLNHQKKDKVSEEHEKNSENHDSKDHKVPITNPVDQVMGEQEVEHNSSRPLSPISTDGSKNMEKLIYNKMLENIEEFQANPSAHTNSVSDSNARTNHYKSQVNPEQPKKSSASIEQKEIGDRSQEAGLLKDSSTDVKTVEDEPTLAVSKQPPSTQLPKNVDVSGSSSPTHTNHDESQVNPEHLTSKLEKEKLNHQKEDKSSEKHRQNSENHDSEDHKVPITNPADQVMGEPKEVLEKPDRGLKEPAQQVTEENISKDLFSENVLEKIKEEKPIYKWLKDKIEGKENNQNLDTLEEKLSQKSGQGNIIEVNLTNKSPQNKDESELQEKFSQEKHGLRPADQKGVSKQIRERLLEDGLLKDSSTDVKTVAEQENADTNLTIDKNRELSKLLKKDETQLKVGVIEEEREDTLAEYTNSHDRNRIALANRNKKPLDWAKRIAESQQEKDTKGTSR